MAAELERVKEEIRRRADLVELVGHRVALRKAGRKWTGLCPFHDDRNPSFEVSPEFGHYRCWSCGAKGDVFNWVMETQRVDFMEAMRILAKETGVEIPTASRRDRNEFEVMEAAMTEALVFFRQSLRDHREAIDYLKERKLAEVADEWELGYAPGIGEALAAHLKKKGFPLALCQQAFLVDRDASGGYYDRFRSRLMFPIRDERGRLIAFGGRIVGPGNPKYINSSDTPLYSKSRVLYGMNRARETIASSGFAVLTEGYLDVIACHRAGIPQAVASLGTALAEEQVKLLKRWGERLIILYDSDEAGQKAADRAAEMARDGGLPCKISLLPEGDDPDTLLHTQGAAAIQMAIERGVTPLEFRVTRLESRLSQDDPGYWTEIVKVLATAETPLELQKYLLPIAARYPGIPDRQAAARALEKMVQAERRASKSKSGRTPTPSRSAEPAPTAMKRINFRRAFSGPEYVLFSCLLDPKLRGEAFQFASHPPLMKGSFARRLAKFLSEIAPPTTDDWLSALEDSPEKEALIQFAMNDREPFSRVQLSEVIEKLMAEKEDRELSEMIESAGEKLADTETLRELSERLRKQKQ